MNVSAEEAVAASVTLFNKVDKMQRLDTKILKGLFSVVRRGSRACIAILPDNLIGHK
jgi:hypothetical protein